VRAASFDLAPRVVGQERVHLASGGEQADTRIPDLDLKPCEIAFRVLDREAEDVLVLAIVNAWIERCFGRIHPGEIERHLGALHPTAMPFHAKRDRALGSLFFVRSGICAAARRIGGQRPNRLVLGNNNHARPFLRGSRPDPRMPRAVLSASARPLIAILLDNERFTAALDASAPSTRRGVCH
jgi:hypothetical protein